MGKFIVVPREEQQDLKNCCKILAIALFGWAAIRVALIPFEHGAFTPSNPDLEMNSASTILSLDTSQQRVVLMVGHHEALQKNLLEWSRSPTSVVLRGNWSFPIPTREELEAIQYLDPPRYRGFDPLFATLAKENTYFIQKDTAMSATVQRPLMGLYRDKAQSAWTEGKNLVMASSEASVVVHHLDEWLISLPENAIDNTQVVISYPRLRVQQLLQIWRDKAPTSTLQSFIKAGGLTKYFAFMDPLGVATAFAKKGIPVIIIDEKGLEREHVDLSIAFGCFVLKVRCSTSGIVGIKDFQRETVRNPVADITDSQVSESKLKETEKVLQDFDCGFFDVLSKASNVHFLYREALFKSCSSLSRQYSRKNVLKKIESILTSS